MTDVAFRAATADDIHAVAELRWQWLIENGDEPATAREDFVRQFAQWARDNAAAHHCTVVVRDDVVIGMAWLAIVARVPTPHALNRTSGDLQCVYVTPEERNVDVGSRLITAMLDFANELSLERVTVHSSPRAIPAYTRNGFTGSDRLLQARIG